MEEKIQRLYRNACFTLNNWKQEQYDNIVNSGAYDYLIIGKEVGEKNGTPHLQGYIELNPRIGFEPLKQLLEGAHIEARQGSQKSAIKYCKKSQDFQEFGEPRRQGARQDYIKAKQFLQQGKSVRDIINMDAEEEITLGTIKAFNTLAPYMEQSRSVNQKPKVFWFYGPAGSGKTSAVYSLHDSTDIYKKDLTKWYDGYDSHGILLIDDFQLHPDGMGKHEYDCYFREFLAILDRHPYRCNIKGSSRQLLATHIYITSQVPPWEIWVPTFSSAYVAKHPVKYSPEWYAGNIDLAQVIRRIDVIKRFEYKPQQELKCPALDNVPDVPKVSITLRDIREVDKEGGSDGVYTMETIECKKEYEL